MLIAKKSKINKTHILYIPKEYALKKELKDKETFICINNKNKEVMIFKKVVE